MQGLVHLPKRNVMYYGILAERNKGEHNPNPVTEHDPAAVARFMAAMKPAPKAAKAAQPTAVVKVPVPAKPAAVRKPKAVKEVKAAKAPKQAKEPKSGRQRKLTAEQARESFQKQKEGVTCKELANELGVSTYILSKTWIEDGLMERQRPGRRVAEIDRADVARMVQLYETNSLRTVGKIMGMSKDRLRMILASEGVALCKRGGWAEQKGRKRTAANVSSFSETQVRELHGRYEAGELITAVANSADISETHIYRLFKKHELLLRGQRVFAPQQNKVKELHGRYMAGEAVVKLAAEIGLSDKRLYALFKRDGFPVMLKRNGSHVSKLTEAQVRELHGRYMAKESVVAIGKEVGLTKRRLYQLFAVHELSLRGKGVQLNEAKVKELHGRYRSGQDIVSVAALVGVPHKRLYQLFAKYDLPLRGSVDSRSLTREAVLNLHGRYTSGEGIAELAGEIGVSGRRLYAIFGRGGLAVSKSMSDKAKANGRAQG